MKSREAFLLGNYYFKIERTFFKRARYIIKHKIQP